jgi:hypothetical protein
MKSNEISFVFLSIISGFAAFFVADSILYILSIKH